MARTQVLKRSLRLRSTWGKRVGCKKSKPNPINSPPVKKLLLTKEVKSEFEEDETDFCQDWGPSLSLHRKYEQKVAELEKKLKQTKAETEFYFLKAQKLDSRLKNLHLQNEIATILQNAKGFGESDEATSACSFNSQLRVDKWRCVLCVGNEACVVVLPCSHLCLCSDCALEIDRCPVCGAYKRECFLVHAC